ncbi:hypothetical protein K502DRAFT_328118 [Neoconidiobolus thromboides FSU 785]|nr:hypothetical protein K502DRAFT_328118 [Neoconidiobolus thromboides FSU 785]
MIRFLLFFLFDLVLITHSNGIDISIYEDAHAYPNYHIKLNNEFINYNELTEVEKQKGIKIKYNKDLEYICFYPQHQKDVRNENKISSEVYETILEESETLIKNKLECYTTIISNWDYKYCYNNEIIQYYVSKKNDGLNEKEDKISAIYKLGTSEFIINKSFNLNRTNSRFDIKYSNNKKLKLPFYISETWGKGDRCDLTGFNRQIELRYLCYIDDKAEGLVAIDEPQVCQYIAYIHVPELCQYNHLFDNIHEAYEIGDPVECNAILPNYIDIDDRSEYSNINNNSRNNNSTVYNNDGFNWLRWYSIKEELTCSTSITKIELTLLTEHVRNKIENQKNEFITKSMSNPNNIHYLINRHKNQQDQFYHIYQQDKFIGVVNLNLFLDYTEFVTSKDYVTYFPTTNDLFKLFSKQTHLFWDLFSYSVPPLQPILIYF